MADKKKNNVELDAIIAQVKSAVKGSKTMLGNDGSLSLKRLPMDIPPLDEILGGGLPMGRITVFAGPEQGGKTYLACKAVEAAQKKGMTSAFIDVEHTYDPEWAEVIGVDTSKLIYCKTTSGEEALNVALELTKAGVGIIVLDSLAGLLPLAEKDEEMEQQFIGLQARLINKGLRKIVQENEGSILLLINQVRMTIGTWAGLGGDTLPGGMGQYFFASIIMRVNKGTAIKDGETKLGFNMRMFTEKNKTHRPQLKTEVPFLFSGELDLVRVTVLRAIELGIIKKGGAWFSYPDFPNGGRILGKQGVFDFLNGNPEVYERIAEAVRSYESTNGES